MSSDVILMILDTCKNNANETYTFDTHIRFEKGEKKKKKRKVEKKNDIFLSVIINNGQSVLLRKLDIDIKFKVTTRNTIVLTYTFILCFIS